MRRDSKLSGVLHVLVHMMRADSEAPMTSERLAKTMETNAVVIRRIFSGLKKAGFVTSEKGHGGGWKIACDPAKVTLADIYEAVGAPVVLAMGHRTEAPGCLVEQSVNASLDGAFRAAEDTVKARLQEVTLADLTTEVGRRHQRTQRTRRTQNEI